MAKWKEDLSNDFTPGILNIVWGHASVERGARVQDVPQELADMADVLVVSYSGLVTEYGDWCVDDEEIELTVTGGPDLYELHDIEKKKLAKETREESTI